MFPPGIVGALRKVGARLVDQGEAVPLIKPRADEKGFWFGGGDICRDHDGALLLCGRYRNGGDSRVGIEAGPRGAELAVLRSTDGGRSFEPVVSLLKQDLAPEGTKVLSIEGASLHPVEDGIELIVSTEKEAPYPERFRSFQKPGTGVWSIDVLRADTAEALSSARPEPLLSEDHPARLHVKDPIAFDIGDESFIIYCHHPFSWTSSNTGLARRNADGTCTPICPDLLPRGPVWDVAVSRVTARLPLPQVGLLADLPSVALYFYDGAECIHDHSDAGRPRGYSCEEIGGLAVGLDDEFPQLERLSVDSPAFVSPHGTGCSRYVSVFDAGEEYLVTWQQSQPDDSQPLVVNRVPRHEIVAILGG